ncbi:MAG: esterase, partial [Pedosphaera sp.]|nr:esterase [Pedosphaera sp.]
MKNQMHPHVALAHARLRHCFSLLAALLLALAATGIARADDAASLRFEITLSPGLVTAPQTGRLLVVLGRQEKPEPRSTVGRTEPDAPFVLGRDVKDFASGKTVTVDATAITFPITNLSELPPGDYFVQALLDSNRDLLSPNAPGNLYGAPQKVHLDPARRATVKLSLSAQIPAERLPEETELVKFVKIQSRLLSEFHGRPIFLRAGIILPKNFQNEPTRKYPLWVRIGGFDTRYSRVAGMMAEGADFRKTWLADETPRMILLHLDGAGPNGDAYQVNSANNGPYGDAITQELIPYVEEKFRAVGQPKARVLSGVSTGGWVSFAFQVFYPDFFNGTWSSCPDGVDFRAFELVNIYDDENAYVNRYGFERPSERTLAGDVRLTMRREVQIENVLGHGNSWTTSGGQWGAWNATYGPRGADGLPVPLWDPQTGKIDHQVAAQWKKYDLRLVLEENWK